MKIGGSNMDEVIMLLWQYINSSRYTIAITGAGISMSAGIMDFQHMDVPTVKK